MKISKTSDSSNYDSKKAKILLSARMCFAKKGFAGTSLTDIQQTAKVSRGVIYHHFRGKDEMIQEIIRENLGKLALKIEENLLELEFSRDGKFESVLCTLAGFVEEITLGPGRAMSLHVWSLSMLNADVNTTLGESYTKIMSLLKKELLLFQQAGDYPAELDIDQLTSAFFSILIPGFIVQRLFLDKLSLDANAYTKSIMALLGKK
jgi:AcrR family transcriptional regulator